MRVVIDGIKQRENNYGIVDGNGVWYNAKGQCQVVKGDAVELEFVVNAKGYKDITKIEKEAPVAPVSGAQAPLQPTGQMPINGMELGLSLKQAQQVQTGKCDFNGEIDWSKYAVDAENFFKANKSIKETIIKNHL